MLMKDDIFLILFGIEGNNFQKTIFRNEYYKIIVEIAP